MASGLENIVWRSRLRVRRTALHRTSPPTASTSSFGGRGGRGRPVRDRLTGRTPRSERGDRGSTPRLGTCPRSGNPPSGFPPLDNCPEGVRCRGRNCRVAALPPASSEGHRRAGRKHPHDGRVAQWESARLTNERLLVRAQPRPSRGTWPPAASRPKRTAVGTRLKPRPARPRGQSRRHITSPARDRSSAG